ncbi:bifunctional DNA-formamidopyrimidine glycosylase/DNA-(apurinic or apyrimidinic site) lyase [Candidatus Venteria ishoeyi]|uniref:Formamidopyrimidine-DNA glycosylase n=1 Tax=Candidatus Venteria ishoeyi TaxID=1899563 RepID=A0A1H6F9S8_9GAMM|nr:bifunctional DNA-formamidopyrimidine glycosylase/DNA-(apurinic or apyrimidinic site) lyase [Candidatus Venteria ishoeyi]SEH06069.1 Formamidopyrimidine-DNA glycosylase [Candidatus Venteria ishoeyi]
MPELPEVETICSGITPHIQSRTITQLIVRELRLRWAVDSNLPLLLQDLEVWQVRRRGKYLLLDCLHPQQAGRDGCLLIHLGMSGNLRILPKQTPVQKHDHIDIVFDNGSCLRYHDPRRFGCMLWTTTPAQHDLLKNLGPEPLSAEFTAEYLYAKSRKRSCAIKSLIMDSHIVVGVGNIYASESLFQAKIHPKRAAGKIAFRRYESLVQHIKNTLQAAIKQGGTTLKDFVNETGKPGYFSLSLQVYGRKGKACPVCGTAIKEIKLGQRSTCYCPACQH